MNEPKNRPSETVSHSEGSCCTICNGTRRRIAFVSYRGGVYQCDDCEIYHVDDANRTPGNQEKLFYSTIDEDAYRTYFQPFRSSQYRYILRKLPVPSGSTLLDVGASYGWMVAVGRELGLDSYGLEPGDAPCGDLQERIYRASLEEYCRSSTRQFDIVTIWHVLEHLRDPTVAVAQIRHLLRDNGLLVVAVPTSEGRLFKLALLMNKLFSAQFLLNELFYFHNPNMHFFYPNSRSLRLLLERSGFVVDSIELLEAFDWRTISARGSSPVSRLALKLLGPLIGLSRLTAAENLVMVARKKL